MINRLIKAFYFQHCYISLKEEGVLIHLLCIEALDKIQVIEVQSCQTIEEECNFV